MNWLPKISFYVRSLFRKRKLDAQLSEEIRTHVEMATEANIAKGIPPEEARYAALREFGNVASIQEQAREGRGWVWLEQTAKDLRFAARALAKAPGFTLWVVAALAIGIGATTAIVSYAWPLVFPTIPFPDADRMVVLTNPDVTNPSEEAPYPFFSFPYRFACIRDSATSFSSLGAIRQEQANLVVAGNPSAAQVGCVAGDYFGLIGVRAGLGRLFLPEEYRDQNDEVVVLSRGVWERRFGADPGIVGRDLVLGGRNRHVVGVLANAFPQPRQFAAVDAYVPESVRPTPVAFPFQWTQVLGKLKPGVTLEHARQELASIHLSMPPQMPAAYFESQRPRLVPLTAYYRSNVLGWVFLGAVAFLHAIACSNAAGLMLARTMARRRELGVRLAIGGSRWQIIRLLLAESLLVAGAAGLAGGLIAHWGLWALVSTGEFGANAAGGAPWNLSTFTIAAIVGAITSVVVTVSPAWRMSQVKLSDALKEGVGSLGDSRELQRMRSGLVVVQAALAVALLAGAGLTLKSFQRLERVSLGFEATGKIAVHGIFPDGVAPETYLDVSTRLRERLAQLPGVKSVTQSSVVPMGIFSGIWELKVAGRPELPAVKFSYNRVSPEYFLTMGIPLREGRGFDGFHSGQPPVAIINRTAARLLFGSGSAVGQYLEVNEGKTWEIVGVAGDIREHGRRQGAGPQLYFPFWQPPVMTGGLVELLRLEKETPAGLDAMIRRAAYAVDPRLVVVRVERLADNVSRDTARERQAMLVMELMSVLAVVLAATGLFAVVTYAVVQRQREFGVRLVLGARPGDLVRLVLRRGIALAVAGVAIGLAAAWALGRFLQSVLFETDVHDPATYAGVSIGLLVIAAVACWLPARRAAKVDPVIALRAE